jgi:Tol biopolymer transport system component
MLHWGFMTRSPVLRAVLFLVLGGATAGLVAAGCSSPSKAPSTDTTEATPSGPTLSLLYTTAEEGLRLHDAGLDTTRTLVSGASYDGVRARSPSGRYVAFSYTTADSAHVALLDATEQTLQPVDSRAASVTYSLAWHPQDDRIAFAYYKPAQSGTRGPGDVFVATPDGATRDVGCSAAREVLHWLPDGSLATRNDKKLYVVAPEGCATRAAADAQKMHHATYAPTGKHLAYIHRELTYESDEREYTPDSSLFLSDARGQGAEKLFGNERQVRHLQWGPEGEELAFDTRVEVSGNRQIAVYNEVEERTVYLTPPNQVTSRQVRPRWSPEGSHVAFTLRDGSESTAAVRVEGQTRRYGSVDGAVWGWVDDRTFVVPGPDSLRVTTLDGQTRYTQPAPDRLIHVWSRDPV